MWLGMGSNDLFFNFALYTRVPQKAKNFLTNREIIPSLRRTSLYGSTSPT